MKAIFTTILTVLLLIFSTNSLSQCQAISGKHIHRCSVDSTIQLGGSPAALGGTPPYTYEWSIDPIPTLSQVVPYVHTSHLLNDTTIANPTFSGNSFVEDSILFYLKVTDNQGCQSFDTLLVTTSQFFIHLGQLSFTINAGDSIYLDDGTNVMASFQPSTYDWNPSYGLSDTTIASGFWASPATSTAYAVTVTDSEGCSQTGGAYYFINVNTVGLSENNLDLVELYPNPTTDIVNIKNGESIQKIELYDTDGKKMKVNFKSKNQIDLSGLSKGSYFLNLYFQERVIRKKIVKK
ncbi:T9SS type A sorting domain-containing protein [Brumimicrobium aurantiacum]|uniref:T9SS C-terminal target domain-containing protein n=1 Tax=Brumimicrobium aurantiacum TaxID=1737063 RepID=A0A3E1EYV7_9FLAO|nr:T9SS type A sorting domain-containing protein [Brumimicrobium aurantiacum]RFC54742.1 T9SS C-terminal target domain-containing protein [Brumimicrobium aurantiacum]